MPGAAGVQDTPNGKVVAVPRSTPLARSWIWTIDPLGVVAAAVTRTGVLTSSAEPPAGAVTATVGRGPPPPPPPPAAATVTTTAGEVVRVPALSTATAVRLNVPAAAGVQGVA